MKEQPITIAVDTAEHKVRQIDDAYQLVLEFICCVVEGLEKKDFISELKKDKAATVVQSAIIQKGKAFDYF